MTLPDTEVGWFFKEEFGLDGLRKQLLATALAGSESHHLIEADFASFDISTRRAFSAGVGGPSFQGPSSTSASSAHGGSMASRRSSVSSVPSSVGRFASDRFAPRQVHATEAAYAEDDVLEEHAAAETEHQACGSEDRTLEEVLHTEVENLADEIAQAEEDGIALSTWKAWRAALRRAQRPLCRCVKPVLSWLS